MSRSVRHLGIVFILAALSLAAVSGCSRAPSERRDARDRYLRKAAEAEKAQDINQAIELCEKALDRRPNLALAHRKLALMLHNYRQDYISALYHYQRYLELAPDTEVRQEVEDLMRDCRINFAASVATFPEEYRREVQTRDVRIRKLETELASFRDDQPVALPLVPPAGRPELPPPAEASGPRIHVVQPGENLATISSQYYGTPSKWKQIFSANRDRLTNANNIRAGTRLVIPEL